MKQVISSPTHTHRPTSNSFGADLASGAFCASLKTRYSEPASTSLFDNCQALTPSFAEKLKEAVAEGKLLKNLCFVEGSFGTVKSAACKKKTKKKKKKKAKKEL